MIHENVQIIEDAIDRDQCNGIVVAAMGLHGPLSCLEEEEEECKFC